MSKLIAQGVSPVDFIEDVAKAISTGALGKTAEETIKYFDQKHQQFTYIQTQLMAQKKRLMTQIPDIESTLAVLRHMQAQEPEAEGILTEFTLADNLFVKARVKKTDKVCLWLGANVMLEYESSEAEQLLSDNLTRARKNLETIDTDLDFLRDQITTTEVNMARVYNWDVQERRKAVTASS